MPSAAEFRSIQSFSFPKECRAWEVYSTELKTEEFESSRFLELPLVASLFQEGQFLKTEFENSRTSSIYIIFVKNHQRSEQKHKLFVIIFAGMPAYRQNEW